MKTFYIKFTIILIVGLMGGVGCDSLLPDPEIVIKNETSSRVASFYKRDCGTVSWGSSIGGNIASGEEITYEVKEGCYDFKAVMSTGQELIWEDNEVEKGDSLELSVVPRD